MEEEVEVAIGNKNKERELNRLFLTSTEIESHLNGPHVEDGGRDKNKTTPQEVVIRMEFTPLRAVEIHADLMP